ncbi:Na+/H+-dicarboxylate symporter [Sphingobacterium allocomposti]|uniref:Na+/H+-dicarboxylate symporter n=1 Tax=Sphingobacterium allocomposti TaxID=415956 RepID=A0A5S5DBW1_9SPHI|nr:dicarboxylate/amino acid:cation symporter [Sphingobacterium composti Yoo et al. 2007 non Ten et al. 2007]TYP92974.1 Na+/H+-dicarboxylate symporter [Sphingobacterium composti Yoo et al. 2007 non Ten et al. 2007]HLS96083.1 dicarboxylate/amino acid:cation symporter [Sphingobacterium sp.]
MGKILENYGSLLLLLVGITLGSIVGLWLPSWVDYLKPLGDIFLNLLFVSIIPLLFFAITSSVANIEGENKLGKTIGIMGSVFLITIVIASAATVIALYLFPVNAGMAPASAVANPLEDSDATWGDRMVSFLTVNEFNNLLSRQSILAFVIFSFLVGISARRAGDKSKAFIAFTNAANEVMKQLLLLLMKAAPIGLGAYFAYQVKTLGPQLFGFYAKPMALYYTFGIFFFLAFFTLYAFIAYGKKGPAVFWKNNIVPSLTALTTCSSLATMPANLVAAKKIGIPPAIANVVIPLGNTLYKNGSAISSILKIYVAFSLLGWNFFEATTIVTAIGITVLVTIVAGGIPNGGYIGEMLMISVYSLPVDAIPAVMIIGTLVDPLATMLNATGDTIAAMLVTRFSKEPFVPQEEEPA